MDRGSERSLLLAALLLAAAMAIDALIGGQTSMAVFSALLPLLLSALLVSLFGCMRVYLARRAGEEARDEAAARADQSGAALFESSEIEPFTIRRTQQQVERLAVPAFTPLLALLQGYLAYRLWRILQAADTPSGDPLLATSFLVGQAFFLFLLGRYLLGLGRIPSTRVVRGPGIYLGLAALASFAAAIAALATELIHPVADLLVAWVLFGLLALLGLENILTMIVGVYSPRRAAVLSTAYHSRLGGFLTDPAGWVRNLGGAIDYQFGFNVSETWFYRLLRRTLLPLFGLLALALYLMSCFVFVGPDEVAVRERFGRPLDSDWELDSGFHLKWPWPFESVRRVPAKRILTTHIGYQADPDEARKEVILWTVPHYAQEDLLLVAGGEEAEGEARGDGASQGFVSMSVPIEYKVSDASRYLYTFRDPGRVVQELAREALIQAIAGLQLATLLGEGRLPLAEVVKQALQDEADALGLGIDVLYVGMQGVHPPVDVASDFQEVVAALESKEAAILEAEAYAISVVPKAVADATQLVSRAQAYAVDRTELSAAEAYHFQQRRVASVKAPTVYRNDVYLRSLQRALQDIRKYILDTGDAEEILEFSFIEKLRPDVFDLSPASKEENVP